MTAHRGKPDAGAHGGRDPRPRQEAHAREEAFRRLNRIDGGAFIGLESGAHPELDFRAQRQALDYVAGITRWRRRLDFIAAHTYQGDFDRMEGPLKQVLRIGLYDILFLDTPPYAAVNEAVALAKRKIRAGAGGLVNGVLRNVLRSLDQLPSPDSGDEVEDMAILHSHPTWMVRRWVRRYGAKGAEALLEWNNKRPVYGVRANTLKLSVEALRARLDEHGVEWNEGAYLPGFVSVKNVQPLLREGLLEEGICAIQDESAGMLVQLLEPGPGEVVVDFCAAPGGKAIHVAELMRNDGRLIAVDIHAGRLSLVERAAARHGIHILEAFAADARNFSEVPEESVDRILVDAPCSGFGVLSKRADLRWNRTLEELFDLTALQDELLDAASKLVRAGGVLVYGTCSIEPDENEMRIEAFLDRHDNFDLEDARAHVPDSLVTAEGYYSTYPPRDGVDGAFGARLRKRASS